MPRGKKTDNKTIYKVLLSYATTNNTRETARQLNLAQTTVSKIIKENKDKPEFVKICSQKKVEFVEKANKIIDKATDLLDKRLTLALQNEDEIETLIDTVMNVKDEDMKTKEKLEIAKKLSKIQLNSLNEISTTLGVIYDKKALASGENTSNVGINTKHKNAIDDIFKQMKSLGEDDI